MLLHLAGDNETDDDNEKKTRPIDLHECPVAALHQCIRPAIIIRGSFEHFERDKKVVFTVSSDFYDFLEVWS